MPQRIQRKRTKGWRLEDASDNPNGVVYVGRPSKYGNPYSVTPASRLDAYSRVSAVEFYKVHLERNPQLVEDAKRELRGKDLMCFCPLHQACHADLLLKIANED